MRSFRTSSAKRMFWYCFLRRKKEVTKTHHSSNAWAGYCYPLARADPIHCSRQRKVLDSSPEKVYLETSERNVSPLLALHNDDMAKLFCRYTLKLKPWLLAAEGQLSKLEQSVDNFCYCRQLWVAWVRHSAQPLRVNAQSRWNGGVRIRDLERACPLPPTHCAHRLLQLLALGLRGQTDDYDSRMPFRQNSAKIGGNWNGRCLN